MKTLALLLTFAVPALASPVTFGASWDGTPPGTFGDLTGSPADLGHPDFAAGVWRISMTMGYTAWAAYDVVGFEGDSFCATAATPCTLGGAGTTLQVYQDRAWRLWATTPSYTHQTSNGSQFAFVQTSPTTWRVGVEDILLPGGDADYQDIMLTLEYLGSGDPPSIPRSLPTPPPAPVSEPNTLVLLGLGLTMLARRLR